MGGVPNNTIYTNCIKQKYSREFLKEFEQFDDYGNVLYLYNLERNEPNGLKLIVYNSEGKIIGSIIREQITCQITRISLYDESNQLIKYIEDIPSCESFTYLFYDANKNVESRISIMAKLLCTTIDEFDQYDMRISYAINHHCGENFYFEYDEQNNLIYKLKHTFIGNTNEMKIYDSNDMEINLSNKTLFNNGFSKIQMILILQNIFFFRNKYYQN